MVLFVKSAEINPRDKKFVEDMATQYSEAIGRSVYFCLNNPDAVVELYPELVKDQTSYRFLNVTIRSIRPEQTRTYYHDINPISNVNYIVLVQKGDIVGQTQSLADIAYILLGTGEMLGTVRNPYWKKCAICQEPLQVAKDFAEFLADKEYQIAHTRCGIEARRYWRHAQDKDALQMDLLRLFHEDSARKVLVISDVKKFVFSTVSNEEPLYKIMQEKPDEIPLDQEDAFIDEIFDCVEKLAFNWKVK